jgi:glycosyltransferase involved in cell wall biosynthesis
MVISFIELEYHLLDLDSFCKVFEGSSHDITLYTTLKIHHTFKNQPYANRYKWVVKPDDQKPVSFFKEHYQAISKADWIYYNTIASHYKTYNDLNFKGKTILRIHNAHTYLQPLKHWYIIPTFFNLFKGASYIVREFIGELDFYYLPKVVRKMDYYCFADENVKNYVIEHNITDKSTIFPTIPGSVFKGEFKPFEIKDKIRICIPGIIDERKKDYAPVIEALKLIKDTIQHPIEVVLLGKPVGKYGQWVIGEFTKLSSKNLSVISFTGFVEQSKFNELMFGSHLLITPTLETTVFRIYKEIYGKTKASGSVGEMVKYGVPNLFPSYIYFDKDMEQIIDRYSTPQSLADHLLKFIRDKNYLETRATQVREFIRERYSVTTISEKIEKFIKERST